MDRRGRRDGFVAVARWATRRGRAYHVSALRTAKRLPWLLAAAFVATNAQASDFNFYHDTFAFANATVFKYYKGIAFLRAPSGKTDPANSYTRRCFVMTRVAMQFHKFARFDPHGQPLDDRALAARVRAVTRPAPWREALPPKERIVFPGYANLREMSKARETV